MDKKLAIIRKAHGEVEAFFGAKEGHDRLEVIFAAAHNPYGIAMDLSLYLRQGVSNQFGKGLCLILVEPGFEEDFFRSLKVTFD